MILYYRCYPTPSSVPTLVFSASAHDILVVSFFLVVRLGIFAGEAGVVVSNLEAMGPTVSVFDRRTVGTVRTARAAPSFILERVDLLVECIDLMSETLDVLRLG